MRISDWSSDVCSSDLAIRQARPDLRRRREFYDWLLDGPVADALRKEQPSQAQQLLEDELREPQTAVSGKVIMFGAGPGDPGLFPLKAPRAANEADVNLYDPTDRVSSGEQRCRFV